MKKLWAVCMSLLVLNIVALNSFADNSAILSSLQAAREKLVTLIGAADKNDQTDLIEEIKSATQKVDAAVAAVPTDAKIIEFKSVWETFKKTRDTEIIPAVLAGEKDKAKSLATGIQAERFKKMQSLLQ